MRPSPLLLAAALSLSAVHAVAGKGARAAPAAAAGPSATPEDADRAAIRELRQRIAARELFGQLALTADQKKALVPIVEEAVGRRATFEKDRKAAAPELRRLLTAYLAELDEDGRASATTVAALEQFAAERRPSDDERADRKSFREDLREDLKALLTPAQIEIIGQFRPIDALRPDDEEGGEARGRRPRGGAGERGGDEVERRHLRRIVRHVLLSEDMLALLRA